MVDYVGLALSIIVEVEFRSFFITNQNFIQVFFVNDITEAIVDMPLITKHFLKVNFRILTSLGPPE